jgi:hypothetical protein
MQIDFACADIFDGPPTPIPRRFHNGSTRDPRLLQFRGHLVFSSCKKSRSQSVHDEPVQDNLLSRSCCSWSYLARFNAKQSRFSLRNLRDKGIVRRGVISQA